MDAVGYLQSVIWDSDSVLGLIDRIAQAALVVAAGADGSAVQMLTDDGFLEFRCAAGCLAPHSGLRLPASSSLSGLAASSGTTVACADAGADPRVDADTCRRLGMSSIVCVPLWRGRSVIGVLTVASARAGAFDAVTIGVLSGLGQFIGAAVSSASEMSLVTSELLSIASSPGWDGGGARATEALAEFVASVIRPVAVGDLATYRQVSEILDERQFKVVCQPIVDLGHQAPISFEALTRFATEPVRSPDQWFADAHACGMGVMLELATAAEALELVDQLPDGVSLSVNAGPAMVVSPAFAALVELADPSRVVIELTEHAAVEDYPTLLAELAPLRRQGARLAVDDAGGGMSSLTHIVKLDPDIIKLDRVLITGVEDDPVRRALTGALVHFADEVGAQVVAEGIESEAQLRVLCDLGIRLGQGYHLGRPAPLSDYLGAGRPSEAVAGRRAV